MSWKSDLCVSDLAGDAMIEATCKRCGLTTTRLASAFQPDHGGLRLDELERRLVCSDKFCKGRLRIALEYQHKMEGFVGGMS